MSKGPLTDIAKGIKKRGTEGTLKRAAERAGETTREFAEKHKHDSGKTGNRSRMALTFMSHSK